MIAQRQIRRGGSRVSTCPAGPLPKHSDVYYSNKRWFDTVSQVSGCSGVGYDGSQYSRQLKFSTDELFVCRNNHETNHHFVLSENF
jgi:hypothetical protein